MSARREPVILTGDYGEWSPITVHLHGGISVRDRSTPYKGAMFAAYPGDVVFSKIDARSGAIGVLPDSIAKAVVTPEFPVFIPDPHKLDGRFLQRVLRTGGFLKALRAKATGTSGRKRITPEAFLDLRVPLPGLKEQQEIVASYEAAITKAAQMEAEAAQVEAKAIADFEAALGFGAQKPLPNRPLFIASFRDMDRWSHEAVLRRICAAPEETPAPFPVVELREVIKGLEVGWSPRCLERKAEQDEWGVLKLSAITTGTLNEEANKALPKNVDPRPSLEVRPGDVLITRGSGQTRLVGMSTYVRSVREKLMMCDLMFRVIFHDQSRIDPRFLSEILRTGPLRKQIEAKRTGAAPMMQKITSSSLQSLTFPLPPLEVQRTMVDTLNTARTKAANLRCDAAALRAKAATDFEAAVYADDAAPETVIEAAAA